MKATQTNMGESERRNQELVSKRGAFARAWFGYEKSDADQKTVLFKIMLQAGSHNRLKHH